MELIRGFHNLRPQHHGCVLTIGNFDGIHRGHQALIARTRALADRFGVPAALLTFEPTPREFFARDTPPPRISTFRGKAAQIARLGIDRLIVQRFSHAFAGWSPEAFVRDLVVDRLGARAVIVGEDFRYGHRRAGDVAQLRAAGLAQGFEVEGIGTVREDEERCSSSALRLALGEPDLARAQRILGRPYSLLGRVRPGLQLGRTLDMPTCNIAIHRPPALRLGVYVVRARVAGRDWQGVASIGIRPTLGLTRCLLETHLFGEPGSLYGQVMEVEFCRFLRPEARFESLEALAAQMQRDKADAQAYFAS